MAVRRIVCVVGGAAAGAALSLAWMPAARADTVVVHGTELPMGVRLSFVGCQSLFDRSDEQLHPYVGLGPGTPPLGERSLGYDLAGGNAVGALDFVPSLGAAEPVGVSAYAADGTTGVAYAGYTSPAQRGTTRMWVGRATLSVPAGEWTQVDTSGLAYTWTQIDLATDKVVGSAAGAPATARDFTAARGGDGPGFLTLGFGCDGHAFDLDAMRLGETTYDLEGLATTATISGPSAPVKAGSGVILHGSLRDSSGALVPDGTLILDERQPGGEWAPVQVVDASTTDPSVTVTPEETTEYRFRSPDRQLAAGAVSGTVTVRVAAPSPSSSPSPGKSATPAPSKSPAPSRSATPSKAATPSATPTKSLSASLTATPSATSTP